MKTWTNYLALLAVLLILGAGTYYYRSVVQGLNYQTMTYPYCDPETESCFIYCDGEECLDDEPYKKVLVNTAALTQCESEECIAEVCTSPDAGCLTTFCSEETLDEGEMCSTPTEETGGEEVVPQE